MEQHESLARNARSRPRYARVGLVVGRCERSDVRTRGVLLSIEAFARRATPKRTRALVGCGF